MIWIPKAPQRPPEDTWCNALVSAEGGWEQPDQRSLKLLHLSLILFDFNMKLR